MRKNWQEAWVEVAGRNRQEGKERKKEGKKGKGDKDDNDKGKGKKGKSRSRSNSQSSKGSWSSKTSSKSYKSSWSKRRTSRGSSNSNRQVCRDYIVGKCTRGNECRFWHPPVCRQHKNWTLQKGKSCDLLHDTERSQASRESSAERGRTPAKPLKAKRIHIKMNLTMRRRTRREEPNQQQLARKRQTAQEMPTCVRWPRPARRNNSEFMGQRSC